MTGIPSWTAVVGPFRFPWGEPGSRRVLGLARSLALAGHHVVIGSGEAAPAMPEPLDDVEGRGSIRHVGLGERPPPTAGAASRGVRVVVEFGRRTVRWLDAQPTPPRQVILYGGGAQYAARLGRWCRRTGVPLVVDVVEWYAPHQLVGGALGPIHLSAKLALRYHYPRSSGVIAISGLLERHYRARGCPVLRVPPTLDVLGLKAASGTGRADTVRLVYFGSPGRKDLLDRIIPAVASVARDADLTLAVYGPSERQVTDLLGGGPLPCCVRVPGRIPQQEVPDVVREADFSVLLRPSERFAHAGFPTKLVESLACGTPVITNPTSDIGRYVRDGVEGLLCAEPTVAEVARALRVAVGLDGTRRAAMRDAARAAAEAAFDYRHYARPLDAFLTSLRGSGR
ncbi:glycosyltransferase [Micromonospora narathiwatensis]|uniref:Glycosyltransferase involved in cell wall bisynthesis n=1 Tax=Micromonospora narathiwatensis TaxID=299146 RepID=A0A1A8Z5V3_9ACTN|nr:glycosyltransferase [Micromonospora narathiwatensis]SBT39322.1 Glycosyltransferase involved in cell wall bisynthesis [Micromonospora narathiwatensis]